MTGRVVPLQSDEAGDPRMGGTPDERVAAVAVLTARGKNVLIDGAPLWDEAQATIEKALGTVAARHLRTLLQKL